MSSSSDSRKAAKRKKIERPDSAENEPEILIEEYEERRTFGSVGMPSTSSEGERSAERSGNGISSAEREQETSIIQLEREEIDDEINISYERTDTSNSPEKYHEEIPVGSNDIMTEASQDKKSMNELEEENSSINQPEEGNSADQIQQLGSITWEKCRLASARENLRKTLFLCELMDKLIETAPSCKVTSKMPSSSDSPPAVKRKKIEGLESAENETEFLIEEYEERTLDSAGMPSVSCEGERSAERPGDGISSAEREQETSIIQLEREEIDDEINISYERTDTSTSREANHEEIPVGSNVIMTEASQDKKSMNELEEENSSINQPEEGNSADQIQQLQSITWEKCRLASAREDLRETLLLCELMDKLIEMAPSCEVTSKMSSSSDSPPAAKRKKIEELDSAENENEIAIEVYKMRSTHGSVEMSSASSDGERSAERYDDGISSADREDERSISQLERQEFERTDTYYSHDATHEDIPVETNEIMTEASRDEKSIYQVEQENSSINQLVDGISADEIQEVNSTVHKGDSDSTDQNEGSDSTNESEGSHSTNESEENHSTNQNEGSTSTNESEGSNSTNESEGSNSDNESEGGNENAGSNSTNHIKDPADGISDGNLSYSGNESAQSNSTNESAQSTSTNENAGSNSTNHIKDPADGISDGNLSYSGNESAQSNSTNESAGSNSTNENAGSNSINHIEDPADGISDGNLSYLGNESAQSTSTNKNAGSNSANHIEDPADGISDGNLSFQTEDEISPLRTRTDSSFADAENSSGVTERVSSTEEEYSGHRIGTNLLSEGMKLKISFDKVKSKNSNGRLNEENLSNEVKTNNRNEGEKLFNRIDSHEITDEDCVNGIHSIERNREEIPCRGIQSDERTDGEHTVNRCGSDERTDGENFFDRVESTDRNGEEHSVISNVTTESVEEKNSAERIEDEGSPERERTNTTTARTDAETQLVCSQDYVLCSLERSVASTLLGSGIRGITVGLLGSLIHATEEYIKNIGRTARAVCEHGNRHEPRMEDLLFAFRLLGIELEGIVEFLVHATSSSVPNNPPASFFYTPASTSRSTAPRHFLSTVPYYSCIATSTAAGVSTSNSSPRMVPEIRSSVIPSTSESTGPQTSRCSTTSTSNSTNSDTPSNPIPSTSYTTVFQTTRSVTPTSFDPTVPQRSHSPTPTSSDPTVPEKSHSPTPTSSDPTVPQRSHSPTPSTSYCDVPCPDSSAPHTRSPDTMASTTVAEIHGSSVRGSFYTPFTCRSKKSYSVQYRNNDERIDTSSDSSEHESSDSDLEMQCALSTRLHHKRLLQLLSRGIKKKEGNTSVRTSSQDESYIYVRQNPPRLHEIEEIQDPSEQPGSIGDNEIDRIIVQVTSGIKEKEGNTSVRTSSQDESYIYVRQNPTRLHEIEEIQDPSEQPGSIGDNEIDRIIVPVTSGESGSE